ncbi:PEP-CTERM/exosortase system-associated acyltransferase [Halomonas sp.]|uniref:PEP-CTERM/exosortase system-associated acyltransferase n=1 Tax=Halomonas sp. TaxID=1486246 RepID=UPI00384BFC85
MTSCSSSTQEYEKENHTLARFMKEFRFSLALTPQEKQRIYRLRYDIYCVELEYEEPTDRQNHLEYDVYDEVAVHCLIEHRRTGLAAACTRLVMPQPEYSPPLDRLPLESYGGRSLTHPELNPQRFPPGSYYEISRLAVARAFRTRIKGNEVPGVSDNPHEFTPEERETFSLLISGLFLAGYATGRMSGKQLGFAMMEPKLQRLLAMSGFHFTQIGEPIDLHGKRSAYCLNREQAEAGMDRTLMPLYQHIKEELKPQLNALRRNRPDSMLYS